MTSLALIAPPLKFLFERFDSAPRPASPALAAMLEAWTAARGGRVLPPLDDAASALAAGENGFLFRRGQSGRDWTREAVGNTLAGLLDAGGAEAAARARRMEVRLRRLFEAVAEAGEPVAVSFGLVEGGMRVAEVEMLAAPLSADGRHVDAILGGIAVETCLPAPHAAHWPRPADAPRPGLPPLVFAPNTSRALGEAVCAELGLELSPHEEREFEDGEHKMRPLLDVRGREACVISSLNGGGGQSANDRLCRLLFFVGCLKDAGAARVSVIAPYLCYARKDRQTKPRDPVTTRYVAQLFEAVGTDHLATVEVHNPAAFQNAFRCDTDLITATGLMVDYVRAACAGQPLAVVSPDSGGMKRAEALREVLEARLGGPIAKAFMEKQRSSGQVTGDLFAGDVSGRVAIIVDDMISTGGSMARTADECRRSGAAKVLCIATHALFAEGAPALFGNSGIDRIVVTDTVPIRPEILASAGDRLVVLPIAPVLAGAIAEWSHAGGTTA